MVADGFEGGRQHGTMAPRPATGADTTVSDIAVSALNHLTLAASDVQRSLRFYRDLLGCREHARWDDGAHLSAGDLWLCLSRDTPQPAGDYTHVAFSIREADVEAWRARLASASVPLWKENRSEGESLYCLDPDGHQLELHAGNLATRLASLGQRPYAGLRMSSGWRAVRGRTERSAAPAAGGGQRPSRIGEPRLHAPAG